MNRQFATLPLMVTAAVLLTAAGSSARADVWTTEPAVSMGGEYSSNTALVPQGDSGQAAVVTATVPLQWSEGVHHLSLEPRVRLGASGGASGLGSDGYYLSGSYRAEWARLNLNVGASIADDSSVIRQPDAGTLIRLPIRQQAVGGKWSASYDLTERDSIEANIDLRHQRYGIRPAIALYDYNYDSAGVRYTRLVTAEHAVLVSTDVVHYRLPGYDYKTDSVNVTVGFAGVVAELWQYRLNVGRSKLSTPTSADHPRGSLYTLAIDRAGEKSRLSLSLVQSLQPSGFGTLVLSKEAAAKAEWSSSERLQWFLSARRAKSSDAFFTLSLSERRYETVSAGLEWALTERWKTRVDVSYGNSTFAGLFAPGWTAHALGASIGVTRRFARRSLT